MQNNNCNNQFNRPPQQQFNNQFNRSQQQFNNNMPPQGYYQNPKKTWYQETWAIILLLIFFFPVGLFLMWKYSNWKTAPKVIVTVIIAFMVIGNFGNNSNTSDNDKKVTAENIGSESSSNEESEKEEKTQEQLEQEQKEKDEAEKKAEQEKAEKEAQEKAEAEQKAAQEAAEYDNSTITFENLARNPDQFKNQKVKFTGTIIQVIEGWGKTQYRMNINNDYDQVVLLTVDNDMLKNGKILENDSVTIKGISEGTIDYKSVLGAKITIPSITVKQFQINQKQ